MFSWQKDQGPKLPCLIHIIPTQAFPSPSPHQKIKKEQEREKKKRERSRERKRYTSKNKGFLFDNLQLFYMDKNVGHGHDTAEHKYSVWAFRKSQWLSDYMFVMNVCLSLCNDVSLACLSFFSHLCNVKKFVLKFLGHVREVSDMCPGIPATVVFDWIRSYLKVAVVHSWGTLWSEMKALDQQEQCPKGCIHLCKGNDKSQY